MKTGFSLDELPSAVPSDPKRPRKPGAIDVDSVGSYILTYVEQHSKRCRRAESPNTNESTQTFDISEN